MRLLLLAASSEGVHDSLDRLGLHDSEQSFLSHRHSLLPVMQKEEFLQRWTSFAAFHSHLFFFHGIQNAVVYM